MKSAPKTERIKAGKPYAQYVVSGLIMANRRQAIAVAADPIAVVMMLVP